MLHAYIVKLTIKGISFCVILNIISCINGKMATISYIWSMSNVTIQTTSQRIDKWSKK